MVRTHSLMVTKSVGKIITKTRDMISTSELYPDVLDGSTRNTVILRILLSTEEFEKFK